MLVALDRGARDPDYPIIPVLLPGFKKPAEIPTFLAQRTWVKFPDLESEDAFHRLVSGIQGKAPGPGLGVSPVASPYRCMAQPPEDFIHRSEYEKVLEALCPKDGMPQASHSVGITTALRGAGGFGKTSLAQKICFDERIRRHYPDGILWTTMGDNLDPESRLSRILDLIRWWTDTEPPGFKDLQAAGAKFREILNKQRVLVVVDDVWSPADVIPFQGLENGSAVLITTRDSQTLPLHSVWIEVDAMASPEAISLLRSGLPDGSPNEFASLADRLGEWPLLLKLVNRQLRDLVDQGGLAISDALQEVKSALKAEGFSAFEQDNPESRHAAASRTILVSVRRLSEKERDLYFQLAVFRRTRRSHSPSLRDIGSSVILRPESSAVASTNSLFSVTST
jgi:NB-ARC domain